MAGIKSINTVLFKYGEQKLREILSQEVCVTEKFDAFRFSFEKNPKTYRIQYYGKNGKVPLNRVDRTVSDLYEEAIDYIENLPYEIRKSIPVRQRFGFSWFPSNKPLVTEYEKRPRHGLILTDITVRNNKLDVVNEVKDNSIYERWATVLKVDFAKPVFEGKLKEETIKALIESCQDSTLEMLKTSEVYTAGHLNNTKENIEALVFEFPDELIKVGQDYQPVNESRSHLFDLLLLNICEHLQSFNVTGVRVASSNPDEGYIEVVSEIFNDYVEKHGREFLDLGLKKPEFLNKAGNLSRKWIRNPLTLYILEKESRYDYLFSIFLANLRKPRYKSGLLSEAVVQSFNQKVEEIDQISGNDFGFLEFSAIRQVEKLVEKRQAPKDMLYEQIEATDIIPQEPDYVKAVSMLTRFFDTDRKVPTGKTLVNVLITNVNAITLDVIEEAQRLFLLNNHKCILIHSNNILRKTYGANEESTVKILNAAVEDYPDLFIGYKIINRPILKRILDTLRPDYEPAIICTEESADDMSFEKDGMSVLSITPPDLIIEKMKSKVKGMMEDIMSKDSYKDFVIHTPKCIQPYWTELKSSFDKFYYQQ